MGGLLSFWRKRGRGRLKSRVRRPWERENDQIILSEGKKGKKEKLKGHILRKRGK